MASRPMKRCSPLVIISEIKIKITMGYPSHLSESPSLKSLWIAKAREGMEKRQFSYTVGRNGNWYNHYGKQYGGSVKN